MPPAPGQPAACVLAIDDSVTIRKLLQMALTEFTVEVAGTGRDGIDRAKKLKPDVILLDYVLPDMKGLDVVVALEGDPATSRIPVVVLSAKSGDDLKAVFADRPAVTEILGKPFSGKAVAEVIGRVLAKAAEGPATSAAPSAAPAQTSAQAAGTAAKKKALAQMLFSRLRERLAGVPSWAAAMPPAGTPGAEPAAVYFAKRLITDEVVERLLADVTGLVGGAAGDDAPPMLQGSTAAMPLPELLRLLGGKPGRTGVLTVQPASAGPVAAVPPSATPGGQPPPPRTLLYLKRGELVFAASTVPDESVRQAVLGVDEGLAESYQKAEEDQKRTGKPVYVSLAEAGRMPAADMPELLHEQGKRVILDALSAEPRSFAFREAAVLPDYVESFGRPYGLETLELERLRETDDRVAVESLISGMDIVFTRAENFSSRVASLLLTDAERRVLTLVDRRNTVRQIVERSGVTPFEAFRILHRMSRLNLIRKSSGSGASSSGSGAISAEVPAAGRRTVLLLDRDSANLREPLAESLSRRHGLFLLGLEDPSQVVEAMIRERPRLAVLSAEAFDGGRGGNGSAGGADGSAGGFGDGGATATATAAAKLEDIAREVRGHLDISDTALAVTCEPEMAGRAAEWRAAGFNAVLVKPFARAELEALLEA
jgi:CheY-like chemotaxis protein